MAEILELISRLLKIAATPDAGYGDTGPNSREDALAILTILRRRWPHEAEPYQHALAVLRAAGQHDAAYDLLVDATNKLPQQAWLLAEVATAAQTIGLWQQSLEYAQTLLAQFPAVATGYQLAATALAQLGRGAESDAVFEAAAGRFPAAAWPCAAAAWAAQKRRDWSSAIAWSNRLRQSFPLERASYMVGVQSLRHLARFDKAADLLRLSEERFPGEVWTETEAAWIAVACKDYERAAALAAELRTRHPDERAGYMVGAQALRVLHRFAECDAICTAAIARFPTELWPVTEAVSAALASRNWPLAKHYATTLLARTPQSSSGYSLLVRALRAGGENAEARRVAMTWQQALPDDQEASLALADLALLESDYDSAEDVLARATVSFPNDAGLALRHALVPSAPLLPSRKDIPETLRRLAAVCGKFPLFADAFEARIAALRRTKQYDEASLVLTEAISRFPDNPSLRVEEARLAEDVGDLDRAVRIFRIVAERFPDHAMAHVGLASVLSDAGHDDDAEAVSRIALERFPHDPAVWRAHALVAAKRNYLEESLRRWRAAAVRFPGNTEIGDALFRAQQAIADTQDPSLFYESGPETTTDRGALTLAGIAGRFESLGGTGQGCEFGVVQRLSNVEPLGLLRWASITVEGLTALLEQRFFGVGAPEQTVLGHYAEGDTGDWEYKIVDQRYGFYMHTFVKKSQVVHEKMYSTSCRRMNFLARKLEEDLVNNNKIFVFKIAERNLTDDELDRLVTAMRAYGDNTLLYVRLADQEHPPGSVTYVRPGLLVGSIDHFNLTPAGQPRTPSMALWEKICVRAFRWWDSPAEVEKPA